MSYLIGILAGMCLPMQTSINTRLRRSVGSPFKASLISFAVGFTFLALLVPATGQGPDLPWTSLSSEPAWIWIGGALGGIFVLANIYLAKIIGVGMTVIVALIGTTGGGVLVDQLGLFEARPKAVTLRKAAGILVMIAGAAMIKLL